MASPTVSCIVAAHNYGRFLGAALESVLAQTYPAELIEVIVVDDGSTDDTADVAARYTSCVRYVRKAHGGLLSTINRGLAEASGELISFLSADDMWAPAKTSRQVAYLSEHPRVGLVHSDMEVVDDHGTVVHPSFLEAFQVPTVEGAILPVLLQRNVVSGGPAMVRASLIGRFFPIDDRVAAWEDWWMAFHVAQVAGIGLIREPLYRYRRHGDNMNLGSSGLRLQQIVRDELPFRRFMLTSLAAGAVTPGELLAGYNAFVQLAHHVSQTLAEPIESVLPVDDHHRAAARARIASSQQHAAAGHTSLAACDLVAALAHNPWDGDAVTRIHALTREAA